MIVAGLIFLLLGLILKIGLFWTVGVILLVVGLVLMLLGGLGHSIRGRRHYW